MLKIIGCGLFVMCGAFLGFGRLRAQRREIALLREMDSSLAIMAGELEFCARPLPEIFELLSIRGGDGLKAFFAELSESCLYCGFGSAWETACENAAFPPSAKSALRPLGVVLGAYDAPRQCAEIALARRNLDDAALALSEMLKLRGRFAPALGACAAGAIAMMII